MGEEKKIYTSAEFRKKLANNTFRVAGKGRIVEDVPEADIPLPEDHPMNISGTFDLNPLEYIFIPGRVFSSKNSEQIRVKLSSNKTRWQCYMKSGRKGFLSWRYVTPFVTKNENAKGYEKKKIPVYKSLLPQWQQMKEGKPYPLYIEFVFVMPNKTSWDWNNLTQLVQDCMVKAGWLPDDSVRYCLPNMPKRPKLPYMIDKNKPGVYIKIA